MKILKFMKDRIKLIIIMMIVLTTAGIVFSFLFPVVDNEMSFIENELQDGDIIFQTKRSKFDSTGMIFTKDGKTFVLEAATPVKLTPLKKWIKRGTNGYFIAKRLRDHEVSLTPEIKEKMKKTGESFMSDEKISSSELVLKIYKEGANVEISPDSIYDSKQLYTVIDNLP